MHFSRQSEVAHRLHCVGKKVHQQFGEDDGGILDIGEMRRQDDPVLNSCRFSDDIVMFRADEKAGNHRVEVDRAGSTDAPSGQSEEVLTIAAALSPDFLMVCSGLVSGSAGIDKQGRGIVVDADPQGCFHPAVYWQEDEEQHKKQGSYLSAPSFQPQVAAC